MNKIGEESWDKKKILIFIVATVAVLAFGFNTFVLGQKGVTQKSEIKGTSVKQDQSSNSQSEPLKDTSVPFSKQNIQKTFEDKIDEIKKDANKINVIDVATSSPAIQKVIKDLQSLQNYPQNQAKEACLKICNGL